MPEDQTVVVQLTGLMSGGPSPFDGQWLVEYDPTRPGTNPTGERLRAHLVCSPDRAQARRFRSRAAAHEYWRTDSGRPFPADRPLTAFNILVELERPS